MEQCQLQRKDLTGGASATHTLRTARICKTLQESGTAQTVSVAQPIHSRKLREGEGRTYLREPERALMLPRAGAVIGGVVRPSIGALAQARPTSFGVSFRSAEGGMGGATSVSVAGAMDCRADSNEGAGQDVTHREGRASIGQVWTRHLAPAAPASRPSLPTQFHDCACHADSALVGGGG